MRIHKSITLGRVQAAADLALFDLAYRGFCVACGATQDECEADARRYICDRCGEHQIYGFEELLTMVA